MHYATGTLSSVNCLVCTVADVLLRPNNDSLHIFAIDDINATTKIPAARSKVQ